MIAGIGVDMVEIAKIARYARRDAFARRVYTAGERSDCRAASCPERRLAEIFACKEAFLKAVGVGIGRGISLQEIEIRYSLAGVMNIQVTGQARAFLLDAQIVTTHLDTAWSRTLVIAMVVLEGPASPSVTSNQ